jgi:hypothetical protein
LPAPALWPITTPGDQGDGFAGLRDADLDVRGELLGGPAKVPGSRSLLVMTSPRPTVGERVVVRHGDPATPQR